MDKFLEVNGKSILFTRVNKQYWIAIKPICEAVGVDYERQRRNLEKDELLCQLPSKQTVVAADNRLRQMVCLPEDVIYGWIFRLRSNNPSLIAYQMECYRVLLNHFRSSLTRREELLRQRQDIDTELSNIKLKMLDNHPDFKRMQKLEADKKAINKELKSNDDEIVSQKGLFD